MSAEIEMPLSPRTINHQKKVSPRHATNELEATLTSIENEQKKSKEEEKTELGKVSDKPAPIAPVVAVTPPKAAEVRKSVSLVDELAASIDSLEESIRRNSPSVTRKSDDTLPSVPPLPSNPKIILAADKPKGSPKKDGPRIGLKSAPKKSTQAVSGAVDGELQKKLERMRERSGSPQDVNGATSPSKHTELDSVLDSLAALSQQPLDKSKGSALNLSNSATTTTSITNLIDSYSNKPLPSPPSKRKLNGSYAKDEPKPAVMQETQEVKPEPVIEPVVEPVVQPKSDSVTISPQVKPDANPLGNLLDQLIVNATTPAKSKAAAMPEETPKRPPPLSAPSVTATTNSVGHENTAEPLSPVDSAQLDEYLLSKTPSKSNLAHQPRYIRGLEREY